MDLDSDARERPFSKLPGSGSEDINAQPNMAASGSFVEEKAFEG